MKKEMYVFDNNKKPIKIVIRNYNEKDFNELIHIQKECFPPPFPSDLWWNKEQLKNHVKLFPEGALCVEMDGKLVASMTSLVVDISMNNTHHSWEEITDSGYIRHHDAKGNTLYIVDISVVPSVRKLGLGKVMMQSMYELVVHLKLERLLGGGRMCGYHRYADQLSAETYLKKVVQGEINDPVVSFLLKCGRMPVGVAENYLEDEESRNYAALMEWKNPFYEKSV